MVLIAQVALVALAIFCVAFVVMQIRRDMRSRLILFALLWLGFLAACAPVNKPPRAPTFVVVVHNDDPAYPETMTLSWWNASTVTGVSTLTIPAHGTGTFVIGQTPDGIELDSTAHPAQTGGQVWQTPDYAGFYVFHVHYPTGVTWKQYEVK